MPGKNTKASTKSWPVRRRKLLITGSDTGVGKTVLTALLLDHLRSKGLHALALKPFATGDRADAVLLNSFQDEELSLAEVNPFFFPAPAAPLVAARLVHQTVSLPKARRAVESMHKRCELLLVEGVGGLLVPLGPAYTVLDWMRCFEGDLFLVVRNRLGALNHTLLTWRAAQDMGRRRIVIVLMESAEHSLATRTNGRVLRECCRPSPVFSLPFLGENASSREVLKKSAKKFSKTLAQIAGVSSGFLGGLRSAGAEHFPRSSASNWLAGPAG